MIDMLYCPISHIINFMWISWTWSVIWCEWSYSHFRVILFTWDSISMLCYDAIWYDMLWPYLSSSSSLSSGKRVLLCTMRNSVNREMLRPEQNIKDYDTMYLVRSTVHGPWIPLLLLLFFLLQAQLLNTFSLFLSLHLYFYLYPYFNLSKSSSLSLLLSLSRSLYLYYPCSFFLTAIYRNSEISDDWIICIIFQDDYIDELVVPRASKDGGE